MKSRLTRRNFLKLGLLAVGSLAFNPFPFPQDEYDYPTGSLARIAVFNKVAVYKEPNWESEIIGYYNQKDTLLHIYYEITPSTGPAYNPLWYRVWGGFIHSAYVQKVKIRFNRVLPGLTQAGQLSEVTVPYTQIHKFNERSQSWEALNRLYYETTHWVIAVEEGPDGGAWYRINEKGLEYLVPAEHLRPIPDREIAPISPDVPWQDKRIEVSIWEQTLTAYEKNQVVLHTQVSTGLNYRPSSKELPWNTPRGEFNIEYKMPSRHMGEGNLTGDPEAYELIGVPWTTYFIPDIGVAFHGTFWHNNYGMQMSHGCVNMRPNEAKWLFRWCYPIFKVPIEERSGWEVKGYGTRVIVE